LLGRPDLAAGGGGVEFKGSFFRAAICVRVARSLRPNRAAISFVVVPAAAQHIIFVFSSRENCFALGIFELRRVEVGKNSC
jgi:hypothetical protein